MWKKFECPLLSVLKYIMNPFSSRNSDLLHTGKSHNYNSFLHNHYLPLQSPRNNCPFLSPPLLSFPHSGHWADSGDRSGWGRCRSSRHVVLAELARPELLVSGQNVRDPDPAWLQHWIQCVCVLCMGTLSCLGLYLLR